ncbi:hypothetical protein DFH07DRAFT_783063 [Mycena maculata]|uniref:Uncharacterized protein n=1 Tax=Mycena maculata TaxID=230809 RepID=A0AAD7MN76_9AGAR|nr:hypothetical protein DFH07DRAFT_783063 [Mycena maculata]
MEVRDELTSNEAGPNLGPLHERLPMQHVDGNDVLEVLFGLSDLLLTAIRRCQDRSAVPFCLFLDECIGCRPSSTTVLSRIIAIVAKLPPVFCGLLSLPHYLSWPKAHCLPRLFAECTAFVGTTAHSSCVLTYPLTRLLCRNHREGSLSQLFASLGFVHILSIPTAAAILAAIMTVGILTPPGVPASHSRPYLSSAYSDEWIKKNAEKV